MKTIGSRTSEIRELVDRASRVVAHYWPMSSFVHHNPIRSLETLRFQEAVRVANRFIGAQGYLANEKYRELVFSGRIESRHLDRAIEAVASKQEIELGERKVSHFEVLRAHLLTGITPPSDDAIASLVDRISNDTRRRIAPSIAYLNDHSGRNGKNSSGKNLLTDKGGSFSRSDIYSLAERLVDLSVQPRDTAREIGREMSLTTWCDRNFHTQLTWLVDRELIKWCEAFLDEGHAAWGMPERDKGFYLSWRSLAAEEWSPCGIKDSSNKIALLPATPEDALMAHLDVMGIPEELKEDYLSFELTALCGWASFINWRAEHKGYSWQATHPIDLVQYLAVRLFYVRELVNQTCLSELGVEGNLQQIVSHLSGIESDDREKRLESARLASAWRLATLAEVLGLSVSEFKAVQTEDLQKLLDWLDEFPESEHGPVWLEAYEAGYQEKLIEQLQESVKSGRASDKTEKVRPSAQAMFCIDVRSEPFRRNLESLGNYETIGFAGFFGIPMRCRAFGQHHETDQLPAIVQPKFTVHEVVREGQKEALARHKAGAGIIHTIHEMLHDMKYHVLTPYVMVESLGWLFGVQIIGRTLAPEAYRKWRAKIRKAMAPPVGTEMAADRDEKGLGLTKEEQATTIEGVLKTMGLVKNFARLVVVAGHTSTSDNNPYEAALNCGACGGNSGKPNARLLASLCNRPHVREHLRKNGIEIPEDTHFLGAVHDTTTDSLEIFDLEDLPDSHRSDLERLQKDLEDAARLTNKERCARLPGAGRNLSAEKVRAEIGRRAGDWSETRPEWGLAGNAAFIIGSRELTRNINLEGRAFLNSHDYRVDPEGALLEGIMMGPMVVGQWINAEHYFSATDTENYGSGSKIYHNVVGRIGIMSGPQSDLRTGLAWQSMMDGEKVYHEPLRLFVVIEAPHNRVLEIVERQPELKKLCDNEWIHLLVVDHDSDEKFFLYRAFEGFKAISKKSVLEERLAAKR